MRIAFFALVSCVFIISCKKTEVYTNDGLTGKWILKEMYDGYAMGGHFQWGAVSRANSHELQFYSNGRYEVRPFTGNSGAYRGTYLLVNDSTLVRTSTEDIDSTMAMTYKIKLSPSELIIDYPNIEGVIRYKYSASSGGN
jgi:hypothetical protein